MPDPSWSPPNGWSPRSELWKELSNLAEGLRWVCINFEMTQAAVLPREDRGVYLICASSPCQPLRKIGAYTILYAGKVTGSQRSLRDRFREHRRQPQPRLKSYLRCYYKTSIHFWYAAMSERTEIDKLEALLVETFNPPCNRRKAPGANILLARVRAGVPITGPTK